MMINGSRVNHTEVSSEKTKTLLIARTENGDRYVKYILGAGFSETPIQSKWVKITEGVQ